MYRYLFVPFATAALMTLGVAGPAAAQAGASQTAAQTVAPLLPEPEGLTLTPFVNLAFAGDYENTPAGFGLALGYGANNRIALEGDFSINPDGEQGILAEFDSTVWQLSGNVLYHFTARQMTPYVALGLGVLGADTNAEDTGLVTDETSYDLAWNWGGGVKAAMSDRLGFRGDLRYFNGDELAPDHWRLYGGIVIRHLGR
jgi:opacity protein-like surface antigen